ncbi:MAG TPA: YqaA family protein [Xanthobacteraceae bacterium]|jgi:membrane protein YqaA with SNARE-associated domain
MLRSLYTWCIDAAGKPHAAWILVAVSFVESSFFPVPPDIMLIPMTLARPDRAWRYAILCTLGSVAGGMLGYLIGALLYDSIGQWIVRLWGYGDKIEAVRQAFADYGAWIILGKGVTPIPYKIVTIASGFAGYNFGLFVALSFLTRGARFFAEAFLLKRYGPRARVMIEKRLGFWVAISALVLVAGIVAVFYLL